MNGEERTVGRGTEKRRKNSLSQLDEELRGPKEDSE